MSLQSTVWFRGIIATPPRVYGMRLRRFSPWHLHALTCLDIDPANPGLDVFLAALVCRERRRDNLRGYLRWQNSIWFRWLCTWRMLRYDHAAQARAMKSYLDTYWRDPPEQVIKKGEGRESCAPYAVKLVASACAHSGYAAAEAWDASLAELACLDACYREDQGYEFVPLSVEARSA